MDEAMPREEADRIYFELVAELGEDGTEELCCSKEVDYRLAQIELEKEVHEQTAKRDAREAAKAKRKSKGPFNPARRVARSPEAWRCLNNYPGYEISSHGRVRSIGRAKPGDWLKPRWKWHMGRPLQFVVLYDAEHKRCERLVGYLLLDAGFLTRPDWMK